MDEEERRPYYGHEEVMWGDHVHPCPNCYEQRPCSEGCSVEGDGQRWVGGFVECCPSPSPDPNDHPVYDGPRLRDAAFTLVERLRQVLPGMGLALKTGKAQLLPEDTVRRLADLSDRVYALCYAAETDACEHCGAVLLPKPEPRDPVLCTDCVSRCSDDCDHRWEPRQ